MEDDQKIDPDYCRMLEALISQAGRASERIQTFAKLRISANERIILLASGMLTLTFSGIVGIGAHASIHFTWIELRPLLWAWKLLVLAVVSCVIANSREIYAANSLDSVLLSHELQCRAFVLAVIRTRTMPENPGPAPVTPVAPSPAQAETQEKIARFLGWVSRASVITSFVLLYIFAKRVLLG